MRSYHLVRDNDTSVAVIKDVPIPVPGSYEVRVQLEAASLNYRDLLVLDGAASGAYDGRIPLSDGAGQITAVGARVTQWKVGDRVAASFFRDWHDGPFKSEYMDSALGGNVTDGVLAESIVLPETSLVAIPAHLSAVQAATLPCAAVTAWQGLIGRGHVDANSTVLVQGTGGVALFALQFAAAKGARIIVLSSSDEKLERAASLGASVLINYTSTPQWDKAVLAQTDGQGASHVLELGGPDTFERSLRAVAAGGKIAQIGVLTGFGPTPNLARLQTLNADILGITVGSTAHFNAMNAFIGEHRLVPIVDRVFDFDDAPSAFAHLRSGEHFGKIVIRL